MADDRRTYDDEDMEQILRESYKQMREPEEPE